MSRSMTAHLRVSTSLALLAALSHLTVAYDLAILSIEGVGDTCYVYDPRASAAFHHVREATVDITAPYIADPCGALSLGNGTSLAGHWLLIDRSDNCTYDAQVQQVVRSNGTGVLFANTAGHTWEAPRPDKGQPLWAVPVGEVNTHAAGAIRAASGKAAVLAARLTIPSSTSFDPSWVLMALFATCAVAVGSVWTAEVAKGRRAGYVPIGQELRTSVEEADLTITAKGAVVLVAGMTGILLAMYYLRALLVYVVIFLFATGGAASLALVGSRIAADAPPGPTVRMTCGGEETDVKTLALVGLGVTTSATWIVWRHAGWAWVLQDLMGLALVLNIIATLRVPTLKVGAVILMLFFTYDVAMVFGSKLFTRSGESVMVAVALGQGEEMPMVFKLPFVFMPRVSEVCGTGRPYTMLGFGDLVIPGVFVSYLRAYDQERRSAWTALGYFGIGLAAYLAGLLATDAALNIMKMPQPALMWINPVLLGAVVLAARRRGDFQHMWNPHHRIEEAERRQLIA